MLDEATNAVTHAREPLLVVIVGAPYQEARQPGPCRDRLDFKAIHAARRRRDLTGFATNDRRRDIDSAGRR
jgi:hypothetical protein